MINIAKQIYAGWSTATKYDLPEAEVIPNGTSSNEKKKLEKFTKSHAIIKEHDNVPLPGFTLYKVDRKNWGSQDQTWLIIDPRGFLVRISNDNLEDILYVTGITEGLIQEKCVWARDDSKTTMCLVPVTSEIYTEAVENTEMLENRISVKEINIGDEVILQNKLTGKYLGTQSLYAPINDYAYDSLHKPQVYLRRQIVEVEPGQFHYQADVKALKVIKPAETPMTREDAVAYMNSCIQNNPKVYFTNGTMMNQSYYSTRGMIKHVSVHAVPKLKMSFSEITIHEALMTYQRAFKSSDAGQLLVEDSAGVRYLIRFPYSIGSLSVAPSEFEVTELDLPSLDPTETMKIKEGKNPYSYYAKRPVPKTYTLDNFAKFYTIVKHVKNETYV